MPTRLSRSRNWTEVPPTASRERPAGSARRLGRWAVAGSLVAATLVTAACGSSEAPTILDTEKVERAIEQSSFEQRSRRVDVSCPSGVHQKKGLTFSCTAVHPSGSTRFVVNQLDGAGQVRYEAR